MTTCTDDWPTTVARFDTEVAAGRHAPLALVRAYPWPAGSNMMTPDTLGYVIAPDGTPVEITTGWFAGGRIFGITFPRPQGAGPDDRDRMAGSLTEVAGYLYGGAR